MMRIETVSPALLILVVAILICMGSYWQALGGPMVLDDYPNLHQYFTDTVNTESGKRGLLGRPLSFLTFDISYALFGDNIRAWKAVNLALHIACGLIIFVLVLQLYTVVVQRCTKSAVYFAAIVTSLWLLHPLHVSTVLYLVQRMAQLSAFFVLAGLLFYTISRMRELEGRQGILWLRAGFLSCVVLAVLSKENGILLPAFALLVETCFFKFSGGKTARNGLLVLFGVSLVIPYIAGIIYLFYFSDMLTQGYVGREFSLMERVLTQSRVIMLYLFQLMIPDYTNMTFFYDNIRISDNLVEPITTLLSIVSVLVLLLTGWLSSLRFPVLGFGIFFFFTAHLVESTILPLELMFEHRNYIASLGIIIAACAAADIIAKSVRIRKVLAAMAIAIMFVSLSLRAHTWSSETELYNFVYQQRPGSQRINAILAEELTRRKQYEQALTLLEHRNEAGPVLQKLYIKCKKNNVLSRADLNKGKDSITSPINDYVLSGIIALANLGIDEKCRFSIEEFTALLYKAANTTAKTMRDQQKIWIYYAHFLRKSDNYSAYLALERAYELYENNPVPLLLAAEWSLQDKRYQAATEYHDRAGRKGAKQLEYYGDIGDRLRSLNDSGRQDSVIRKRGDL